jgi:transcriptional regulator with XRE-family HTH domain
MGLNERYEMDTTQPTEDNVRIGERLRSARKNIGMLQETAAQHLGISRPLLVAIEKGQRAIRRSELRELAMLYHVSESWITTDPAEESVSPLLVNPDIIKAMRQITKARAEKEAAWRDELDGYRKLYDAVGKCLPQESEE